MGPRPWKRGMRAQGTRRRKLCSRRERQHTDTLHTVAMQSKRRGRDNTDLTLKPTHACRCVGTARGCMSASPLRHTSTAAEKGCAWPNPPCSRRPFCHVPEAHSMAPPPVAAKRKHVPALPPCPGWKESMSDDAQCEETVYKSGHAAPHRKRHLSVAHVLGNATPERGRLLRAPIKGLWRMLAGKAARGSRRLLRAPINGVRRRVRGPAADPKRGLLADFHETQKNPPLSPGLFPGSRR